MFTCNGSSLEGCGLLEPIETEMQESDAALMPTALRVALAAIMIFMITIGFLGNAIVCLIVYQKPAMRSAINLLLATLAFSDIMLSLLCMPFTAVTFATTDWSFGVEFCRISIMLYWLFVLEGVSILLIISVDRFLIIVQRQTSWRPIGRKYLLPRHGLCRFACPYRLWSAGGRQGLGRKYRNAFWDTVNRWRTGVTWFCLLSLCFLCHSVWCCIPICVFSTRFDATRCASTITPAKAALLLTRSASWVWPVCSDPKSTWTWVLKPGPSPLSSSCSLASPCAGCHIRWWVCWRCSVDASTSARPFTPSASGRCGWVTSRQSSTRDILLENPQVSWSLPGVHAQDLSSLSQDSRAKSQAYKTQQHLCVQQWDPVFCLGFAPKYETFEVMVSKNTYELKTWQITPPIIICSDEGNSICCLKFIKAIFIYVPECGICFLFFLCWRILQVLQFCKTWNIGK